MGRSLKKSSDPYANRMQEMRLKTGLNRREFCERFDIPYRTVSDWESGQRHAPEYVLRLLEYYLRVEGLYDSEASANGNAAADSVDFRTGAEDAAKGVPDGAAGKEEMNMENGETTYAEILKEREQLCVREPASVYKAEKRQGEYTLNDYYALPDDVRAELIDGYIYVMEAPTSLHQVLVVEICYQLRSYIDSQGGRCMALASPLDVQLDCDDRTVLQPDIMVICDRGKVTRKGIYGAPDLVMEILSPSTRSRDMVLKLNKYQNAGVKEYWVIDPDRRRVMVYDLRGDTDLSIYGFDDVVPVGLFDGKCTIDFRKIYDYMDFLYET